jgi:hypothetical protein
MAVTDFLKGNRVQLTATIANLQGVRKQLVSSSVFGMMSFACLSRELRSAKLDVGAGQPGWLHPVVAA